MEKGNQFLYTYLFFILYNKINNYLLISPGSIMVILPVLEKQGSHQYFCVQNIVYDLQTIRIIIISKMVKTCVPEHFKYLYAKMFLEYIP